MSDPRFHGIPLTSPAFADDDGSPDSALVDALAHFNTVNSERQRVLDALPRARLLVPVVAVLDEVDVGDDGLRRDKSSHMATVSMVGAGGKRALLAFTCTAALAAWDPQARPIPAFAPTVAAAALEQGEDAVLIDVAGPVRFAVTGEALAELAHRSPE